MWMFSLILCWMNKPFKTQMSFGPLGCWSNPIKCDGPPGERAYLDRLRGDDGRPLLYQRVGSLAIPSPYGNIVDLYVIGYEDTGPIGRVCMDMYFEDHVETRPIRGFRLKPVNAPVVETVTGSPTV